MFTTKLSEDIFDTPKNEWMYSHLFSFSREALYHREIQIIEKMIKNRIIEIESYYLCDSEYDFNSDRENVRFARGGRSSWTQYSHIYNIDNIYKFQDYNKERPEHVLSKYTVYNYFKNQYNVELDTNGISFYIKELDLTVVSEMQTVRQFICRCLNKDINLAIISLYKDGDTEKIALRKIIVKDFFFEIYNPYSLDYTPYQNNINDVLDRLFKAHNHMDYIMIERRIPSNIDLSTVKSCAICENLKGPMVDDNIATRLSTDMRLYLCTKNDYCGLNMKSFNIRSNKIKCDKYRELNERCIECFDINIPYVEYYLKNNKFCSSECEERHIKKQDEYNKERMERAERMKNMTIDEMFEEYGF